MNILVIGNGFDLAHNLPTKYSHFLHYIRECLKPNRATIFIVNPEGLDDKFHNYFLLLETNNPRLYRQLRELCKNNIWVEYFMSILKEQEYSGNENHGRDGWIDFESEISRIIKALDEIRISLNAQSKDGYFQHNTDLPYYGILRDIFYVPIFGGKKDLTQEHIQSFKAKSLDDLNRLIRCLEIYLSDYVQNLPVSPLRDIEALDIDYILSFNYTNTAERLYHRNNNERIAYDYIHGKADIAHNTETCNMVLGIDEYLPEDRRDSDNEFIEFKKFYQRIYKATGSHYKDWIKSRKKIKPLEKEGINVYIYGHSLDVTDRDILRDLILQMGAITTIFYYNKRDLGQKIANLVKVIGEDELIKRTGGQNKSIIFKETTRES